MTFQHDVPPFLDAGASHRDDASDTRRVAVALVGRDQPVEFYLRNRGSGTRGRWRARACPKVRPSSHGTSPHRHTRGQAGAG